jgi:hypothetical protein
MGREENGRKMKQNPAHPKRLLIGAARAIP